MESIFRGGKTVIMQHPETPKKKKILSFYNCLTPFLSSNLFFLKKKILRIKAYGNRLYIFVCAVDIQTVNSQHRSQNKERNTEIP